MQLAKTNLIQKLTKKNQANQNWLRGTPFFAEYDNIVPVITIKIKKEEQKIIKSCCKNKYFGNNQSFKTISFTRLQG